MFKRIRDYWKERQRDENGITPAQWRAVEAWKKTLNHSIEDYHRKFRTAPVGAWSHAEGTFCIVMDEGWQFNPDHTGTRIEYGPFGHERGRMEFIWKEVADFTIACKVTSWPELEAEADETEEADSAEEQVAKWWADWEIIRYDFRTVLVEGAEIIAMSHVSNDGGWQSDFWHSQMPLVYDGKW